ncbi:ABC transporter ATP-binding protein [Pseudonocardia alaniniphila]|uniref:ABC transporter ATP-binding protein/permease n=1 Tax=Pseudonocardia alaniniphila TaxID=75291 RepID=A0ABS9TFV1_9PSEU|nr:ABC transporter ATP-binding protein [Pseudonocardia alaniniphila]MCH6167411.1 ABC transporter ATP-binding protein/permease [Pseudonocardia alaniniphila]
MTGERVGDKPGPAPLIGVDDIGTPSWAQGYESVAKAGLPAVARAAPRTAVLAARWAWQTSRPLTIATAVLELLAGVITAFGLLATANVFSRLLEQGPTPERVVAALPALAVVVAAAAARGLLDAAVAGVSGALVPRVEQRAQDMLHTAVIGVELAAFDDPDFAELVERATTQGPDRVRAVVRDTGDLLASLVSVTAAVVTAGLLHPLLAPVVLLAALPRGWASIRTARLMFSNFVRTNSHRRRLGVTSGLITGRDEAAEVRAFTTQEVLLREHRRISDEITRDAVRLERDRTSVQLVGRTLAGVGTAAAYLVLAFLIYAGSLELALAGAAALAMRTAAQAATTTIFQANRLYEATFYLDLYRSALTDAASRRRLPPVAELHGDPEVITLAGASFRYPGQDEYALADVDVTMRRGEVIALVGENGSGKSTLAKLITGLYLPTAGSVTWDGVDTAAVDAGALHARVAVVLQDPVHWPMTAENNVRIGRLERADPGSEQLDAAARLSGTDTVVADLPNGWATVLSRMFQTGRDLSGGQWQRLSVARGLYRDAPLVVADEPTAALDARAEHAVFGTLHGRSGAGAQRITVLVTHRLANVRHADQILVLEQGRLIEHGRHEELMAHGGTYHELFTLQARAYAESAGEPDTVPA